MTGYEYGNTRLRARWGSFLSRADYSELLAAGSLDRVLGVLGQGPYAADVEASLFRASGLERLDEAVRRHLGRVLAEMRTFYEGEPAGRVELLLSRWDVRNLMTLLRAVRGPQGSRQVLGLLVAAGSLDETALRELAAQPGLRELIDLMVAWQLPDRATARHLLRMVAGAETDAAEIERALIHRHAETVSQELDTAGDDAVTRHLRHETDIKNLVTTIRVWEVRRAGEPVPDGWILPGGTLGPSYFELSVVLDTSEDVAGRLAPLQPFTGWEPAAQAWSRHRDPGRLADDLDIALTRLAWRWMRSGDPLGPAVPVAYVWWKEREASQLRMVGRVVAHGLDPGELESRLVAA